MLEKIKIFYQDFSESLEDTLSERMLRSGKTDFTIWDGYKAFFGESIDTANKYVFDPVKKPIKDKAKNLDKKVQAYINDHNDNNMTVLEKSWNGFKGIGKKADKLTSAGPVAAVGSAFLAAPAVLAALPSTIAAAIGVGANAAGTTYGTYNVAKGTYDVATAKTPEEAQEGGGKIAIGSIALAASAATAKQTLTTAREAGIPAANPDKLSTVGAMAENIKIAPKAIAQAIGVYKPAPFTALIKTGSPELEGATHYMSKPNEVKAYRFNPNGSEKEILANNPNVFKTADGKYAIPNKWNPDQPYIIDPSKEQMIMMYGKDDFAVCDGSIFKGSYVDTAGFKANGALNYQDPSKLPYGQVVEVTKQAPGAFVNAPQGTEVKTLEGIRTVGKEDVIAIDHAGNPYVTTKASILKRNFVSADEPSIVFDYDNYTKFQAGLKTGQLTAAEEARLNAVTLDKNAYSQVRTRWFGDKPVLTAAEEASLGSIVKGQNTVYGLSELPKNYTGMLSHSYSHGDYSHYDALLQGRFVRGYSNVPSGEYISYADGTKITPVHIQIR